MTHPTYAARLRAWHAYAANPTPANRATYYQRAVPAWQAAGRPGPDDADPVADAGRRLARQIRMRLDDE